jgi:[NiFe] hydrogenase assembly HybE family chaperone
MMTVDRVAPSDAELTARLADVWRAVAGRMACLPIYNPALEVQVTDLRRVGGWRFAVVVTPWFMNLVALPETTVSLPADGDKLTLDLPAGPVELTIASDDRLGRYGAASLFSPMDDFADPEATWATAVACLDQLCAFPADGNEPLSRPVDRRRLLRFGLGGEG